MNVSSVNVVRVSENLKTLRLLTTLRNNTLDLFTEENRLATGYKLLTPSEDPVGAARAVEMNQILERQDQILENLRLADGFLTATDQAVVDINTMLVDAQSIASEHVGSTSDDEQRRSSAIIVESLIEELVAIGNRSYMGRYLFAGRKVDEAPFVRDSGYVQFVGDQGDLLTHIDELQQQAYNMTGDRLFGALSSEVKGSSDLNAGLTTSTRIAEANGITGNGITLGTIRITETGVGSFTIDLAEGIDNFGDIIDKINQAASDAGSSVTAALNVAGNGIQLTTGGPTIEVDEVSVGTTARDLGVLTSGAVGMVPGGDVQTTLTELTRLGDLNGLAIADLAGGFTITNGIYSTTIDTSTLAATDTMQDLLRLINTGNVYVLGKINTAGTGIDVVNQLSGSEMTISENGGTTADALGIRSFHRGTSLSSLNDGRGVSASVGKSDFRIVARDGSSFEVDLNDANGGLDRNGDGIETMDDVLLAINAAAAGAGVPVTTSMATTGNGIRLVDNTGVNGTLRVERMNLSYAVDDLGLTDLRAAGAGASVEVVGQDVNGVKTRGVFTPLQELRDALQAGDQKGILMAGEKIQEMITLVNRSMGEVGSRSKAMTDRHFRTEEAVIATRKALSEVRDLDYSEAITRFQQTQMALQASLTTGSRTSSLSLMDFLG